MNVSPAPTALKSIRNCVKVVPNASQTHSMTMILSAEVGTGTNTNVLVACVSAPAPSAPQGQKLLVLLVVSDILY